MKRRKKFLKASEKPNLEKRIVLRLAEADYNKLSERAANSPFQNLSAYCRHKLLKGDKIVSLTPEEKQFLPEFAATLVDIKHFKVAVEAATKNKSEEYRKNYILSLGVQKMWSSAIMKVVDFIYDFIGKCNSMSNDSNAQQS